MEYTKEEQKAHRKLWVEALRSGNYKQSTGSLCKAGGYCCLGVACDISSLGEFTEDGAFKSKSGRQSYTNLTNDVVDWLGLATDCGWFRVDGNGGITLVHLNDVKNYPFNHIADVIESEPAGFLADA